MNILVTGSTGLVGTSLSASLIQSGERVRRLVRKPGGLAADEAHWDPATGSLDTRVLEGFDAVVHLAGENIGAGRWTAERRRLIRESRIQGTKLLAQSLARLSNPPPVLVSASAIGFYGDRKDEFLREDAGPGRGFLASLCEEWEGANKAAADAGIRVVQLRMGMILSAKGGALARMLLPFKLGTGGRIGSGKQYMSWITLEDLIGAIGHVIRSGELRGPINTVAPGAVTNEEFAVTLGRVLSRPARLPLPAFAVRLALGIMAEELLLFSARVEPARLLASGYRFQFPRLEQALRHILRA